MPTTFSLLIVKWIGSWTFLVRNQLLQRGFAAGKQLRATRQLPHFKTPFQVVKYWGGNFFSFILKLARLSVVKCANESCSDCQVSRTGPGFTILANLSCKSALRSWLTMSEGFCSFLPEISPFFWSPSWTQITLKNNVFTEFEFLISGLSSAS